MIENYKKINSLIRIYVEFANNSAYCGMIKYNYPHIEKL